MPNFNYIWLSIDDDASKVFTTYLIYLFSIKTFLYSIQESIDDITVIFCVIIKVLVYRTMNCMVIISYVPNYLLNHLCQIKHN